MLMSYFSPVCELVNFCEAGMKAFGGWNGIHGECEEFNTVLEW